MLVAPRWPDVLARPEAIERASGADDVLARARIVPTLDEALAGVTHLCATVMTPRDFGPPTRSPREHFEMLLKQELPAPATQGLEAENASNSGAAEAGQGVAFLFGCERFGMANDDVYRCHVALSILTAPDYVACSIWRRRCSSSPTNGGLALGGFQVVPPVRFRRRASNRWPTPPRWPPCWRTGSRRWWPWVS